jgi:P pilus assembly chaperone PapD
MKKKFVITLVSVAVIALFALFMATTKAPDIQADRTELRINYNDGSAEEIVERTRNRAT